jgi:hypothetical protein
MVGAYQCYHTDQWRAGKLDHDTYPVGDPNSLADESLGDCRISRDFTMFK